MLNRPKLVAAIGPLFEIREAIERQIADDDGKVIPHKRIAIVHEWLAIDQNRSYSPVDFGDQPRVLGRSDVTENAAKFRL